MLLPGSSDHQTRGTHLGRRLLALILASACGFIGQAQSAHFGGVVSSSSLGFTSYGGIAIDGDANGFVADNLNRRIVETSPSGQQTILSTGGMQPEYMALDKAKNLYVAVTAPAGVLKFPYSNGAYGPAVMIGYANLKSPWGIAVDSASNVFVSDHASNAIYKFTPAAGSYTQSLFLPAGSLKNPAEMAIDGKNNLYVADSANNRVLVVSPTGAIATPFPAFASPSGVGVDASGNIAVTSNAGLTYLEPTGQGTYKSTLINSTFTTPYGLAFGSTGTIFIVDSGAQQLVRQTPPAVPANFGTVTQGMYSQPLSLLFVFDQNATLNSSGPPVGGYLASSAYTIFVMSPNGGTCQRGQPFLAGQTCVANVDFTPAIGGPQSGEVDLIGASGGVLASAPGQGNGVLSRYVGCGTGPGPNSITAGPHPLVCM